MSNYKRVIVLICTVLINQIPKIVGIRLYTSFAGVSLDRYFPWSRVLPNALCFQNMTSSFLESQQSYCGRFPKTKPCFFRLEVVSKTWQRKQHMCYMGPATLQNTQLIRSWESCHLQIPSLAFWPYLNFNYCLYPHCWVDPSIWLVDVNSWALAHIYQIHRVLSPTTNNIHQSVNDLHVCWWNGETLSCHATYTQVLIITIGRFPMRKCRYAPPLLFDSCPLALIAQDQSISPDVLVCLDCSPTSPFFGFKSSSSLAISISPQTVGCLLHKLNKSSSLRLGYSKIGRIKKNIELHIITAFPPKSGYHVIW